MQLRLSAILLIPMILAIPSTSGALLPLPIYPDCGAGEDPSAGCPNDLGRRWNYISYVKPEIADNPGFRPEEIEMGSGMHVDRAWQITTGRDEVVIAVLDSGIYWDEAELQNKHWLNRDELPLPWIGEDEALDYDANGDGIFNIQDYSEDSRVDIADGTDRADHMLDPSDLIAVFSNGDDADGNGYVDDISGWDFHWNDNNPYDDTRFGHGTGEAKGSCGEGDNGNGQIGVCPNCRNLNIRIGDSFVANGDNLGEGFIYAVDRGASLIQVAAVGFVNSPMTLEAIDYTYRNGVLLVASAADETSMHRNVPANGNHGLYTHAVRADTDGENDATTTYINFSNCTNYGGRLQLSAPSTSCSSGATEMTAGLAGLVYSKAMDEGIALTADEAKQIITMSVDDINVPESATDPTKFLSQPGWDQHFGYGRINARKAVEMVTPATIPPSVDIVDPLWYQVIYPNVTPQIDIVGHISANRADSFEYVVEYAVGIEPREDGDWIEIDSGVSNVALGSASDPVPLAIWDVSSVNLDLDKPLVIESDTFRDAVDQFTVTVRIRALDNLGNLGEMRKTVALHDDPDLLEGFPKYMGASGEASLKMDDLDGDGRLELIYANGTGWVHAVDERGEDIDGWPVHLGLHPNLDPDDPGNHLDSAAFAEGHIGVEQRQSIISAPAIGDIDGDGGKEVVILSIFGEAYLFEGDGSLADGWPQEMDFTRADLGAVNNDRHIFERGFFASPVLADLDANGDLEILATGMDGWLYAWDHDGSDHPGFPVEIHQTTSEWRNRIISTPAVGDVDGDGDLEIVTTSNEADAAAQEGFLGKIFVLHHDGNDHNGGPFLPGWPVSTLSIGLLPVAGEGIPQSPMLADLDGDGDMEIGIVGTGSAGEIYDETGTVIARNNPGIPAGSKTKEEAALGHVANPTFADLTDDGIPEFIVNMVGTAYLTSMTVGDGIRWDADYPIAAYDMSGPIGSGQVKNHLPGWPNLVTDHQFFANPIVADISGDGVPEVMTGSGGYLLHAYDTYGDVPDGWPKFTASWILASPAVGDLDCDQMLEVAVTTRDGWLFVWNTDAPSNANVQWGSFHGNNHNDGRWDLAMQSNTICPDNPPPPPVGDDDDDDTANDDDDDAPADDDDDPPPPSDDGDDDDCSCANVDPNRPVGPNGWMRVLLIALPLLYWRRRAATEGL